MHLRSAARTTPCMGALSRDDSSQLHVASHSPSGSEFVHLVAEGSKSTKAKAARLIDTQAKNSPDVASATFQLKQVLCVSPESKGREINSTS